MAKEQLGAPPSKAKDTATKQYVDAALSAAAIAEKTTLYWNDDLNSIQDGTYFVPTGSIPTNSPPGTDNGADSVIVQWTSTANDGDYPNSAAKWVFQIAYQLVPWTVGSTEAADLTGAIWGREFYGSQWSLWHKMGSSDSTSLPDRLSTTGKYLASGDWNDVTQAGFYSGNGLANAPFPEWFSVVVTSSYGPPTGTVDGRYCQQIATAWFRNTVYVRSSVDGVWADWEQLGDRESVDNWIDLRVSDKTGLLGAPITTDLNGAPNGFSVGLGGGATANSPVSASILVETITGTGNLGPWKMQTVKAEGHDEIWHRHSWSGTWGAWRNTASQGGAQTSSKLISTGGYTFMCLGDSITASSGNGIAGTDTVSNGYWSLDSWPLRASILSNGKLIHIGSAAEGGFSIRDIRDTYLPVVLRMKPDLCLVLAGQNNLGTLSDQDLSDLGGIYDSLIAAGITPVLATNVPSTVGASNIRLNRWIKHQAQRRRLPLVDFHKVLVDPNTGLYRADYTSDGVHPETDGRVAMGQAVAESLEYIYSSGDPDLSDANVDEGLLTPNPLFLGDNATLPLHPNGWIEYSTNIPGSRDLVVVPGIPGRQYLVATPDGVDHAVGVDWNIPNGNAFALSTGLDVNPGSTTVELFSIRPGWSNGYQFRAAFSRPIKGVFRWQGATGAWGQGDDHTYHFQMAVRSGDANAFAKLSQFTAVDLTAQGIDTAF